MLPWLDDRGSAVMVAVSEDMYQCGTALRRLVSVAEHH
jgi:hypothetical protein